MTSIWDDFPSHADVRQAFQHALQRGRLTQSYLFLGPAGVGKQRFATKLAQCLLCFERPPGQLDACGRCSQCRPFQACTHPDFLRVDRDPGKRELTVAKFIGERDQRGKAGLCYELSIRPAAGSRKIAIINDADTMNDEAANALLKTLEEPPEEALLILIAANLDALLPTIKSRCQTVRFSPLPDEVVIEYLQRESLVTTPEEAHWLASLSGGSLVTARQLAQPGFREIRQDWLAKLALPSWDGLQTAQELASRIEKLGNDTAEQRQYTLWLLQAAAEFYRSALRGLLNPASSGAGAANAASWISRWSADVDQAVDLIGDLLERCIVATVHLQQNVSIALCLEALCHDLSSRASVSSSR
ncbi:DNA polymerase III subunit delta' [bacterium]|nr:DNA polymerase III subunit delta' [bacterium]